VAGQHVSMGGADSWLAHSGAIDSTTMAAGASTVGASGGRRQYEIPNSRLHISATELHTSCGLPPTP
jgi:hypothetical protein